jgi:hypothetical protein
MRQVRDVLRLKAAGVSGNEIARVLTKLVNNWPNSRLADLLPWAWTAEAR